MTDSSDTAPQTAKTPVKPGDASPEGPGEKKADTAGPATGRPQGKKTAPEPGSREARLAEALRANLRRRKAPRSDESERE